MMATDATSLDAIYGAPVVGSANAYAAQTADDTGVIAKTGQFLAAMPGAVASDVVNSSGAIVKFFGGDGWNTNEHDMINSLDVLGTGAGDYYTQHKGLVDGAELLATSIIPGTIGLKALRAAQTGLSGSRILATIGFDDMVNPKMLEAAREAAYTKAAEVSGTWNHITSELTKALVVGAGSNLLDAAAIGTAATLATNASPLYDGMSATDMAKNLAIDTVVWGGIGTLFSAAKTFHGLRGVVSSADAKAAKVSSIYTGDEYQTAPIRIANTIASYARANDAGIVPNSVTMDTKNAISEQVKSMLPESDTTARDSLSQFMHKFIQPGSDGKVNTTEAINFLGRMKDVSRADTAVSDIGAGKSVTFMPLEGNALFLDTVDGSLNGNAGSMVAHLGDAAGAGGKINLVGRNGVELRRQGADTIKLDGSGYTADSLINTQAAYFRAAALDASALPEEITITKANIPMVERLYEEAQLATGYRGETHPVAIFKQQGGWAVLDSLQKVHNELRSVKEAAAQELANAGATPEAIAAHINVSTDFLLHPESEPIQARSLTGNMGDMDSISRFLQAPRNFKVTYDLGTTASKIKSGINKGKELLKPNKFSNADRSAQRIAGNVENAFNSAQNSQFYKERLVTDKERLVTSPVEFNGVPSQTDLYEQQAIAYLDNINELRRTDREMLSNQILGDTAKTLLTEKDLESATAPIDRQLSTASFIGSANNPMGTLGSMMQRIGSFSKRAKDEAQLNANRNMKASANLIANDPMIGAEWQTVLNKLHVTEAKYVVHPDYRPEVLAGVVGSPATPAKNVGFLRQDLAINNAKKLIAQQTGKDLPLESAMNGDEFIPVSGKLMENVILPHVAENTKRLQAGELVASQMMPGSVGNAALSYGLKPMYAPPLNTAKFKHFLFVTDAQNKLVGNGSTPAMIVATSAENLLAKRGAIEAEFPGRFTFISKGATADYYKALGAYQYDRGLNTSYVNSALQRSGKLGDFTPDVSPAGNKLAAEELLAFHERMASKQVRDAVELRFANTFQKLAFQGKQFADAVNSKFASKYEGIEGKEDTVKNPYRDAINMALDISNPMDTPRWQAMNAFVERNGDSAFAAIKAGWNSVANKAMTDAELTAETAKYNELCKNVGLEPLYTNMAVKQFADQAPMRPVLRKFMSTVQAALNGTILGLDPIQAINTMTGQVMTAAEFSSLINMIKRSDAGAGHLAGLMDVKIPDLPYSINSTVKMMTNAMRRYISGGQVWKEAGEAIQSGTSSNPVLATKDGWYNVTRNDLRSEYTEHNLLTSISQQYHNMLDAASGDAESLTDGQLIQRMQQVMDNGRKLTGNNLAEEITRFISADMARQLTDAARSVGKIENNRIASTYWNTAVNRVHGINLASQRAAVFHGVIGQSIGMFMTYQHNLMQQLFRYASTGDAPAMKALAVSQFGMYGLQGLPAFNAVATHIIGNAYGNTDHTDPYTWSAKNFDAQLPGNSTTASWILYGAGSNALGLIHPDLKFNLYSRGDINPRELTLFPTSVADTIQYKATVGAIKDIFDTAGNIANGAPVGASILQGLAHNNLNRPLSGLATVLQGAQTTASGSNIGDVDGGITDLSNSRSFWDKWTIANFVRIAGAKPLDDAASADAMYRVAAYQAKNHADIKNLAESMRLTLGGGNTPSEDDMQKFAEEYAKRGGDIRNFRGFVMNAYKTANTNQVMALALKLQNPQSRQVQAVLGATNDDAWIKLMNSGKQDANIE